MANAPKALYQPKTPSRHDSAPWPDRQKHNLQLYGFMNVPPRKRLLTLGFLATMRGRENLCNPEALFSVLPTPDMALGSCFL